MNTYAPLLFIMYLLYEIVRIFNYLIYLRTFRYMFLIYKVRAINIFSCNPTVFTMREPIIAWCLKLTAMHQVEKSFDVLYPSTLPTAI